MNGIRPLWMQTYYGNCTQHCMDIHVIWTISLCERFYRFHEIVFVVVVYLPCGVILFCFVFSFVPRDTNTNGYCSCCCISSLLILFNSNNNNEYVLALTIAHLFSTGMLLASDYYVYMRIFVLFRINKIIIERILSSILLKFFFSNWIMWDRNSVWVGTCNFDVFPKRSNSQLNKIKA